jgi:hypothetical protein
MAIHGNLPKRLHPGFKNPSKKPPCRVDLDRDNALLGSGPCFYTALDAPLPTDLTTNSLSEKVGTPELGYANEGRLIDFGGGTDRLDFPLATPFDETKPYTLFVRCNPDSYTDLTPVVLIVEGVTNNLALSFRSTNGPMGPVAFGRDNGSNVVRPANTFSNSLFRDGNYHTVVVTYNGQGLTTNTNYTFYRDETQHAGRGAGSGGVYPDFSFVEGVSVGGSDQVADGHFLGPMVFAGGVCGVAWTHEQVIAFNRDPYQLLKPATPIPILSAEDGATITANQTEDGDTQSANIAPIITMTANQVEEGDTQSASILNDDANITANQTEEGDSQTAAIENLVTLEANQTEVGDSQSAGFLVDVSIAANQVEDGDTQAAAFSNTADITANQLEDGDSQAAALLVDVSLSASQSEEGDSQAANFAPIVTMAASLAEEGDSQTAAFLASTDINLAANQLEEGDSQTAAIGVVVDLFANQVEAGDAQSAEIINDDATVSADQAEDGDSQTAAFSPIVTLAANQVEEGDTQSAAVGVVVDLFANQLEAGDTQTAEFISDVVSTITADQAEEGDSQVAAFTNIVTMAANQLEEGDSQSAIFAVQPPFADITGVVTVISATEITTVLSATPVITLKSA